MDTNQTVPTQDLKKFIDEQFEQTIPTILKYLEIPSQSRSFDSEYLTNGLLLKSCELVRDWILSQNVKGLKLDFLNDEGYSPFIFVEIEGSTENDDTILFYGHMDKQPPMEPWREGLHPYKPVVEDGKLYARGGADDGYAAFASVLAVKACQTLGLKHPRVVMLLEADEESGSDHFPHYLEKLKPKIGDVKLVICLDSGCGNYEQLWMTTTLRGMVACTFTVRVLKEGVHSGDASGVVPSSFRIARLLLDRIEDPKTGEVSKEFQVNIPGQKYLETEKTAQTIGQSTIDKFPWISNDIKPVSEDPFQAYINRIWKAQLSVTGADGIPSAKNAGNVLRPQTTLKLSLRLPPTADPVKCQEVLRRMLTENVPYGATVEIVNLEGARGWSCPTFQPFIQDIFNQASQAYFNKPALALGEGGSIPLMTVLQDLYPTSQFIVTGVLGPQSNAHGPNEFLHLSFCRGLIASIAHFIGQSYPNFTKKQQ